MTDVVLTTLVHDRPGVLARIANVFYRRGVNIHSLGVAPTEAHERSRLTLRVRTTVPSAERAARALRNLVDVVDVEVLGPGDDAARELCLVRLPARDATTRAAMNGAVAPFGPRVIAEEAGVVLLELAATSTTVDAFLGALAPYGATDVRRTSVATVPWPRSDPAH